MAKVLGLDLGISSIGWAIVEQHDSGYSLLEKGVDIFQEGVEAKIYSVYVRHCASKENMQVHINRVHKSMPPSGYTSILSVTDKQYGETLNYWGKIERARPETPHQLEFF